MKKHLQTILAALTLLVSTVACAQINFGVTGGLNFAKQVAKDDNLTFVSTSRPTIFVGGLGEKLIAEAWYFESGLILSNKGGKFIEDGDTETIKLTYAEVPLKVKYKHALPTVSVFGTAGFYAGFAFSGKYKYAESDGTTTNETLRIGNTQNDDVKGLDAGFGIGGGVELVVSGTPLQIGFSYDSSLLNLEPASNGSSTLKNRVFSLRAAYFISSRGTE
jgi:hypothetical protein